MDKAEMDSILTNVRMERISRDVFDLPAEEQERIDMVLNKTLKFVAGDLMEEDFEEEQKVNNHSEEEEEGKFHRVHDTVQCSYKTCAVRVHWPCGDIYLAAVKTSQA